MSISPAIYMSFNSPYLIQYVCVCECKGLSIDEHIPAVYKNIRLLIASKIINPYTNDHQPTTIIILSAFLDTQ